MSKVTKDSVKIAAVALTLIAGVVAAHFVAGLPMFLTIGFSAVIATFGYLADLFNRDEHDRENEQLYFVRGEDGRTYLVPARLIYIR